MKAEIRIVEDDFIIVMNDRHTIRYHKYKVYKYVGIGSVIISNCGTVDSTMNYVVRVPKYFIEKTNFVPCKRCFPELWRK